jgi:peptidyl-prolyl cis-trans isomerase B (cyclophilin B)
VTSLRRLTLLLLLPLLASLLVACGSGGSSTPKTEKSTCSYPDADARGGKKAQKPPGDPDPSAPTELTIATDRGDVKVSLDAEKAPCTVNSFVSLAKQGYFDNTTCHRLTTDGLFVLQCGDTSATGQGGPGYSFADELVDKDPRLQPCSNQTDQFGHQVCTYPTGTLAMANAGPDTNGSQFFLVYKDSPLGSSYTPFGRMSAAGLKVVQAIAAQGLAADQTAPKQPVTITSVS